jgi:hypothetical protein
MAGGDPCDDGQWGQADPRNQRHACLSPCEGPFIGRLHQICRGSAWVVVVVVVVVVDVVVFGPLHVQDWKPI